MMGFTCPPETLDVLMPMHVVLSADGAIEHMGPTLTKMLDGAKDGTSFFADFEVRRPGGITGMPALLAAMGQRLHIRLRSRPATVLRGTAMPMGAGAVLNLSFGIGVLDAIRAYDLSDADFAATDLTMEILYVVEAKSAVMDELGQLNQRLQGAKSEAEERALTDTLTGLRNRRGLDAELQRLIVAGTPFGLLHMDLDYFKAVNDIHGHATGDEVLRKVSAVLSDETRRGDTVARVGGDEFVAILPGIEDASLPETVARRIVERLAAPIDIEGRICRISISVGVTLSSFYDQPEPDRMLNDSDQALYASKHGGRSQVQLARP